MRCACLQDIKKPHTEAVRGWTKEGKKTESGEMKPNEKMMHQKSPHVKRHNGPQSREMLLLAIFRYGRRIENAMTRVENAVRERRRS
jgi:hypothetical protein